MSLNNSQSFYSSIIRNPVVDKSGGDIDMLPGLPLGESLPFKHSVSLSSENKGPSSLKSHRDSHENSQLNQLLYNVGANPNRSTVINKKSHFIKEIMSRRQ